MTRTSDDYPHEALVDNICMELFGFAPHIHSWSGSSVYIHFNNLPNGMTHKMRISDHDERVRYGYKWQLRLDGVDNVSDPKQFSRYFDDEEELIEAFRAYYDSVESNRPKEKTWGL